MRRKVIARTSKKRLAELVISEIDPIVSDAYSRGEFGHGWDDLDSDGQNERAEILIKFHYKRGKQDLEFATDRERRVVKGSWKCKFTGSMFYDASDLDIDHLVPLKNAWVSGANTWTDDKREKYSNGVGIRTKRRAWLLPVSSSANRSKGWKSPDIWLPDNTKYHLNYVASWIRTKQYWKLSITSAEYDTLIGIINKELEG